MSSDRDGDWDSYPGDPFHSVNREDWDEDDWEAFLLRQDALTAKYQELFETLRHHPSRDEIIAREMRWNLPSDIDGAIEPPLGDEDDDEPLDDLDDDDARLACSEEFCDGCTDYDEASVDELEKIPAYTIAQEFALVVERQLTARLRDSVDTDEDAVAVTRAALDVSARIVNGHGIGYERDSLCGNIACCKRAIVSLGESLDALLSLRQRGVLLPSEADELLRHGRELGDTVARRIEELRGRVWWL